MYHRNRLWGQLFLDPEAQENPPKGNYNPSLSDEELDRKIRKMISKTEGNAEDAIGILLRDNAEIREKNRQAQARITELSTPKKGVVILEGKEAEAVESLKTKGVDLTKVPTLIEEHGSLKDFKASVETKTVHGKAAQALGWDETILSDQLTLRKLHIEMKDETIKDGDKTTVRSMPYVRPADNDKAPLEPLGSFAEKNFPKPYIEMLKATKGESQEVGEGTGTEFILQSVSEQGSGAGGSKKDLTKSYLEANYGGKLPFEVDAGK